MQLTTKYNLEQKVYFMHNNKVMIATITALAAAAITPAHNPDTRNRYNLLLEDASTLQMIDESLLFPTKQELLSSL